MKILPLNGKWKVKDEKLSCRGMDGLHTVMKIDSGWMSAIVPGEIHLDLMRAGRLDEPLVSLNAKKSRWPEKRSWWFMRSFKVPAYYLAYERQQLVFEGLDLYAQIFLNGIFIGESKNAFVPQRFDVRHIINKGVNKLMVRLTSGAELVPKVLRPQKGEKKEVYGGRMKFPGISHLRKPQFTYGWDWVDSLPNIGIWRGVYFEAYSNIVLHDIRINTDIRDQNVFLRICAVVENIHPWSERKGEMKLMITPPVGKSINHSINFSAQVGRSYVNCCLKIPNAKLWWPNGMGEQPLYRVAVSIIYDNKICDQRELDIGLRTVSLKRSDILSGGSHFCIQVNGQDVFCKGANWIPADAIIARVSTNKYETLISDAKNANINMLRVWGGGIYESPDFYNACDRLGILVWQDFMFACSEYPDNNREFCALVREEAEKAVMLLRHHPSIVLWCGNNENVWAFAEWWNKDKDTVDKDLKIGGSIIYNQILPDVCYALDPERPYWPSSPLGGEQPNSELDGDCHWWNQFTMNEDINRRISHEVFDECKSRFVSEYGVIGPCHISSIKEYLNSSELDVDSLAWREHTNTFEKDTIPSAICMHYADPDKLSVQNYIYYGQMFQAFMYGNTIEALRFRKNDPHDDCQGALIWMYNDCWGETGWTPIDYYLRRKASYYWIRHANMPLKAIVRRRGNQLVTRVVNDALKETKLTVHYGWMRVDGSESRVQIKAVSIDANSMIEITREVIPNSKRMDHHEWIYVAYLSGKAIKELSPSVWLLVPYRDLAIPDSDISIVVKGSTFELVSKTFCHGVNLNDNGKNIFSDNYFDLIPGVPKPVRYMNSNVSKKIKINTMEV